MVDRVCTSPDRVWTLTVVCKDENRMILYCIPAFYDPGDEGRQAWGFRCRFGQEGGWRWPNKAGNKAGGQGGVLCELDSTVDTGYGFKSPGLTFERKSITRTSLRWLWTFSRFPAGLGGSREVSVRPQGALNATGQARIDIWTCSWTCEAPSTRTST